MSPIAINELPERILSSHVRRHLLVLPEDPTDEERVRLNKRTKTAIDWDDSEIDHFLLGFSSKKGIDIEAIFLAKSAGFCGFH